MYLVNLYGIGPTKLGLILENSQIQISNKQSFDITPLCFVKKKPLFLTSNTLKSIANAYYCVQLTSYNSPTPSFIYSWSISHI